MARMTEPDLHAAASYVYDLPHVLIAQEPTARLRIEPFVICPSCSPPAICSWSTTRKSCRRGL